MASHIKFYNTADWRSVRRRQLVREPWCQSCPDDLTPAFAVDHIVPISAGGAKRDPANLQSLCEACHGLKSRCEQLGQTWIALRYRGCSVDGAPRVAWGPEGDQPLGANRDRAPASTKR
ncbi:HNH endonuclease [Bradyrhizobium sp. URHC0002]